MGSFLNAVIWRLPRGISIIKPPSQCPRCHHRLRWWENIPVASYLSLRGRCSHCHAPIPLRYLMVELLSATFALLAYALYGFSLEGLHFYLYSFLLLGLFFTDLETQILPDSLTVGGLIFALSYRALWDPANLIIYAWGALAGGVFLLFILLGFYLWKGYHGMGYGDIKMMAMIGGFLGFPVVILSLVVASTLGTLLGVGYLRVKAKDWKTPIPFGIFLAVGGWFSYFLKPWITL